MELLQKSVGKVNIVQSSSADSHPSEWGDIQGSRLEASDEDTVTQDILGSLGEMCD